MSSVVAGLFIVALGVVILALYLLTLQRAMNRCSPSNRTMSPDLVWLQLVPVFGLYWHFRNVTALGQSLENEYQSRGVRVEKPHVALGYAMGICLILGYGITLLSQANARATSGALLVDQQISGLRLVGAWIGLAGIALTVLYWMRVSRTSRHIATLTSPGRPPATSPVAVAGSPGMSACTHCGAVVPPGRFCPRCGAERTIPGAAQDPPLAQGYPRPAGPRPAMTQPIDSRPTVPWSVRDVWLGTAAAAVLGLGGSWALLYALSALSIRPDPDLWIALSPTVFYLLFAVVIWWFSVHKHGASARTLGFARFKGSALLIAAGLLVLQLVFEGVYAHALARAGFRVQTDLTPLLKRLSSPWPLLISIVVVGPFVEETLFRGFIFGGLRSRYDWRVAAVISAALFAAFHLELTAFIPLFVVGFMLAYLYQRSNSIWPGIVFHMCMNGLAMLAYYLTLGSS